MLVTVLAACVQATEPGELPSGSAPAPQAEPLHTPAVQLAEPENSPSVSAPTREAEPLQTPTRHPTEQVIPLPTTTASATPTRTVPSPTLPRQTTKATPPPAPTVHPGMTPETGPAIDSGAPFVQVSAGSFHTCGLRADGTITCWGAHGEDERLTESAGLLDSPPGSFSQIDAPDTITPSPYARTER